VKAKFAVIGVIGQGYVGLPLALVFSEAGFQVTGFDVDGGKVATLNQGCSYIKHVGSPRVRAVVDSGRFSAQHDSLPVSKSSTPPSVPDQLGGLPALEPVFRISSRVRNCGYLDAVRQLAKENDVRESLGDGPPEATISIPDGESSR
jgi:hypothetical protein